MGFQADGLVHAVSKAKMSFVSSGNRRKDVGVEDSEQGSERWEMGLERWAGDCLEFGKDLLQGEMSASVRLELSVIQSQCQRCQVHRIGHFPWR